MADLPSSEPDDDDDLDEHHSTNTETPMTTNLPTGSTAEMTTSTRDLFAAAALQGVLASHSGDVSLPSPKDAAELAREFADALLAELHDRPAM